VWQFAQDGLYAAAFVAGEWLFGYRLAGIGGDNHFLREFNDNFGILTVRRAPQPQRRREATR
jgi:hypothetical protein